MSTDSVRPGWSSSVSDIVDAAVRTVDSGADVHLATAALIYSVPLPQVTDEMRQKAKIYDMAVYRAICRFQDPR